MFSNFNSSITCKINTRDDYQVKSQVNGVVLVLTKQDEKKDISDVFYVSSLKHNLMSVGQMSQHGYEVTFTGPTCTILDKPLSKRLIAQAHMTKIECFP